jgi:hypothetical protein
VDPSRSQGTKAERAPAASSDARFAYAKEASAQTGLRLSSLEREQSGDGAVFVDDEREVALLARRNGKRSATT